MNELNPASDFIVVDFTPFFVKFLSVLRLVFIVCIKTFTYYIFFLDLNSCFVKVSKSCKKSIRVRLCQTIFSACFIKVAEDDSELVL